MKKKAYTIEDIQGLLKPITFNLVKPIVDRDLQELLNDDEVSWYFNDLFTYMNELRSVDIWWALGMAQDTGEHLDEALYTVWMDQKQLEKDRSEYSKWSDAIPEQYGPKKTSAQRSDIVDRIQNLIKEVGVYDFLNELVDVIDDNTANQVLEVIEDKLQLYPSIEVGAKMKTKKAQFGSPHKETYELFEQIREMMGDTAVLDEMRSWIGAHDLQQFVEHADAMYDLNLIKEDVEEDEEEFEEEASKKEAAFGQLITEEYTDKLNKIKEYVGADQLIEHLIGFMNDAQVDSFIAAFKELFPNEQNPEVTVASKHEEKKEEKKEESKEKHDKKAQKKMKIKLDNQDKDDGSVLVMAENEEEAEEDQTIMGSSWEFDGDFAYAIIDDAPGLVAKLEAEGYDVDDSEYWSWESWEELRENLSDEYKEMFDYYRKDFTKS